MLISTPENEVLLVPTTHCAKTPENMDKLLHGSYMFWPLNFLKKIFYCFSCASQWKHFCERFYWRHLLESVEKVQVWLKLEEKTGTLHKDLSTFIMSPYIPLEKRKVLDNSSREYQNTPIVKYSLKTVPLTGKLRKICHIQSGHEWSNYYGTKTFNLHAG